MQLSDEEVAKEVSLIQGEASWPWWPWLPLKSIADLAPGERRELACLFSPEQADVITIYYLNVWDLAKDPLLVKSAPKESFESVEALVRAGWIGD
jgi:hypothetical protein